MRTFSFLLFFIFNSNLKIHAQDSIEIKFKYKPGHLYMHTLEQKIVSMVDYEGDSLFLKDLSGKKMNPHSKNTTDQHIQTRMETSEMKTDSTFGVVITFLKSQDESGKPMVPEGSSLFGQCRPGKMPVMDSVSINGFL
ncbi:MAG: hypothetical protein ACHQK8_08645, partial [Bacteroidia bacterium]